MGANCAVAEPAGRAVYSVSKAYKTFLISETHLVTLFLLGLSAFATSAFAGIAGLGGGLMLLAILPNLIAPAAVIPLHALTQWVSNGSRLAMGSRHIDYQLVPALFLGTIVGVILGSLLYQKLPLDKLPALLGCWLLWLTWGPKPKIQLPKRFTFLALGLYQSAISMLLGATGPLGTALLMRHSTDRDYLVVNTALYMTINHSCRVGAFVVLGFHFSTWWSELAALVCCAFLGTWVGTRLRPFVSQEIARRMLKMILTLLALRLLGSYWI